MYRMALHERLYDLWVESRVQLAAEHRRRDVEAAANLALGKTVYVLRGIVRELPPIARALEPALRREGVGWDDLQVQEQR